MGDRIRVFYQSQNTEKWERILRNSSRADSYDEIILKAAPAEVAETLELSYDKEKKMLSFTSPNAIQYNITKPSNEAEESVKIKSFTTTEIDASNFEKGEYTFSFASGGEPYTLKVVF